MTGAPEIWYRAEVCHYSIGDDDGHHVATSTRVQISEYRVMRHTPKGVWLRGFLEGEQFVLGKAMRQIAVPTKELALRDCELRKRKHIRMCEGRLTQAQNDLRIITQQQRALSFSAPRNLDNGVF